MGRGGENTPAAGMAAPDLLASNPQFAPFLEPDFNAGKFASKALAGAHITAQAQTEQLQVSLPYACCARTVACYIQSAKLLHAPI